MIVVTNGLLRAAIARHGYSEPEPGDLHLCGLRGAVPIGPATLERRANVPNQYNDTILVWGTVLACFRGSVDPGATWTQQPPNPRGVAHLSNGCWLYRFGQHKGHPALVQAGPVEVWRDGNRDNQREAGETVERGYFGIDIHAGGSGPEVNDWSAGCQILQGGWGGDPWKRFYAICEASHQTRFRYYLMDAGALAP